MHVYTGQCQKVDMLWLSCGYYSNIVLFYVHKRLIFLGIEFFVYRATVVFTPSRTIHPTIGYHTIGKMEPFSFGKELLKILFNLFWFVVVCETKYA